MMVKAFLMTNVPLDNELLTDFVENTLNTDVRSLEFCRDAVLVTLDKDINLEEAAEDLKKSQDLLEAIKPIEVLDPELCDNMIVVDKLDDKNLSLQFLKLYIESTFADGNDVILECKVIPEHSWTVLSLMSLDVVTRVLEKEDHIPLPSMDYHIQIKPFYRKVHATDLENWTQGRMPSVDTVEEKSCSKEVMNGSHVSVARKTSNAALSGLKNTNKSMEREESKESIKNESVEISPDIKESDESIKEDDTDQSMKREKSDGTMAKKKLLSSSNCRNEKSAKVEDTLNIPKLKYELLKDTLGSMKCQFNYSEKNELLTICSTDAIESKGHIIDVMRKIDKSILTLSEEESEFLKQEKLKESAENFVSQNLENTTFTIDGNRLIVYSFGNSNENLDKMTDRLLHKKTVQLPKGIPMDKIREFRSMCSYEYLITMRIDDNDESMSLTGLIEDVQMARTDLEKIVENFKCFTNTFEITGKEALFVNRHKMKRLEEILHGAEILKKVSNDKEISIQYSCTKFQMKDIEKCLKVLKERIEKSEVDLTDLNKESLALVSKYFKTSDAFIDNFERVHQCCVLFDGLTDIEYLGLSAAKDDTLASHACVKKQRKRRALDKQKRVMRLPSCKLQIKPFGNILKEKTDVLVCGIDDTLNLKKTKVGQSFLKVDGGLQNQMAAYSFSTNGVCVNQRNIPKTKSKAIAFITLHVWQPGVTNHQLNAAVLEVLDTANKMGISSISFPPLGPGRAFKYPVDEASKAVITAIDTFLKANHGSSQITLINCLAPEKRLYYAMNKAVDVVFKENRSGDIKIDENDSDGSIYGDDNDDDDNDDEIEGASALQNSDESEDETSKSEVQMEVLNPECPLSIVIVHTDGKDITSMFKTEMTEKWLYEDYFESGKMKCISEKFLKEVFQIASNLGVWVSKHENRDTKGVIFKIKGRQADVFKMKSNMANKVIEIVGQAHLILKSDFAPKRGSMEFIEYAAKCSDTIPSYWTRQRQAEQGGYLVDVDLKIATAISDLMVNCWDQQLVGRGNDAANIPANSSIKVINVQRIENRSLFLKYSSKRKSIFSDMAWRNQVCIDIAKLAGGKGPALTMKQLPAFMKKELYFEINELYLFHGTKLGTRTAICDQGIDSRLSSPNAMFGQGVYLAESSTKSDQYADPRDSRSPNGTDLTMFLTRASLGDVFLCNDKHESVASKQSQKLRRPPCMTCFKDVCTCGAPLFHSVMGDGKWLFREFVVYDNCQCYPEYFITYQRY